MIEYRTRQGETLDLICWRRYGGRKGAVEAVMDANRHLAGKGPILPPGLVIQLPDLPAEAPVETGVRLWD